VAYRLAGQYEEAMVQAKKAVEWEPTFLLAHIALTASCSLTGRENQASEAAKGILKINPNFSVDQLAMTLPYKDQSQVKLTIDALRKAGLK
jgi:tetratricopeptide (TPR) repeat protein